MCRSLTLGVRGRKHFFDRRGAISKSGEELLGKILDRLFNLRDWLE